MSLEILDPRYTLEFAIFPQLMWALWMIGGMTVYLIIRAVLKLIL